LKSVAEVNLLELVAFDKHDVVNGFLHHFIASEICMWDRLVMAAGYFSFSNEAVGSGVEIQFFSRSDNKIHGWSERMLFLSDQRRVLKAGPKKTSFFIAIEPYSYKINDNG
jgi:hypothetical protein